MPKNVKSMRRVWVNSDRIKSGTTEMKVRGLSIEVDLGPYDVPRELVGTFDESSGTFRIDFSYIDDEPGTKHRLSNEVEFIEGVESGKLLSIILPVQSKDFADIDVIEARLNSGFRERTKTTSRRITRDLNQRVAAEVLHEELRELVPQ